ncbi:MAG TPA: hypothetical protein DIW43_08440 [Spongiibacteraceae bacterium]|nr:hypothetical protein [Spongiibacteraceae bacterium]HCS27470.1 hypothetical protein [Spongiibacteraceae bacterium]|tara:strand:+ start:2754 stop:3341 length:588 start_codon:yes stop_codon:yes gene_type:complete
MKKIFAAASLAASVFIVGCSSTPEESTESSNQSSIIDNRPDWVKLPTIEDGLASTQCVGKKGSSSIMQAKATALARAEIARQIEVKATALDKTYQRLTEASSGDSFGSSFESVSKTVANQNLSGTRAVKAEYVMGIDGQPEYCVMVTLSPALTKNLFADLMKEANANLSGQNEEILYEEFKAYKAHQELDQLTAE